MSGAPELLAPDHGDWQIAYSFPRQQHIAARSLGREGFQCWYPLRKVVTRRPLASISSKARHRRRHETVERIEPVYGCYLFIRRPPGCNYDLGRVHELTGVVALCRFGERPASIRDFEIQLIRLAEAHGKFNIYSAHIPGPYRLMLDVDPRSGSNGRAWHGTTKANGERQLLALREEVGRVARLIAATEVAAHASV